MDEAGHRKDGRTRTRDEQDGVLGGRELDRPCLDSAHGRAVGDVQGVVFGEPAAEHVALTSQLLDLAAQRGDLGLGLTPKLRELVNVAFSAPLGERCRERTAEAAAQASELIVLGGGKGLRSFADWNQKDPFEMVQMNARKGGPDRSPLHRVDELSHGRLANHSRAKGGKVDDAAQSAVVESVQKHGRCLARTDVGTFPGIEPHPKRRLEGVELG